MEGKVVDKARMREGHAVKAPKYQADEFVLKRRDKGVTGGFHIEDDSAVLRKISLAGEGKGSRRKGE